MAALRKLPEKIDDLYSEPAILMAKEPTLLPCDLGFSVADGEDVRLLFSDGDLVLTFTDWREQQIEHRFPEALAFRWSYAPSHPTPRDDSTYVLEASEWLQGSADAEGVPSLGFRHYILCFNAEKVLEVVSR